MSGESRKVAHEDLEHQPDPHAIHHSGWNEAASCIEPLYNLYVGAAEIVVTLDLPYVNPSQVKLQCPLNDVIEVYAATSRRITFKDLGVKHRHGEFTCYHARIRIPAPVNKSKITSRFKRGVMEVHLPRLKWHLD